MEYQNSVRQVCTAGAYGRSMYSRSVRQGYSRDAGVLLQAGQETALPTASGLLSRRPSTVVHYSRLLSLVVVHQFPSFPVPRCN